MATALEQLQELIRSNDIDLSELNEEIRQLVEKAIYGQPSYRRLYPDKYSDKVAQNLISFLQGDEIEIEVVKEALE